MNEKEKIDSKNPRTQNYEPKKMNKYDKSNRKKDKNLPWWVELLFVQIGLPDKLLIKILRTKKKAKEFIHNDKKSLLTLFFIVTTFVYFYPVIKHSQNKLDCEAFAKNYIVKNKNLIGFNKGELKMLSTNFCYGGEEIYEIENLKN